MQITDVNTMYGLHCTTFMHHDQVAIPAFYHGKRIDIFLQSLSLCILYFYLFHYPQGRGHYRGELVTFITYNILSKRKKGSCINIIKEIDNSQHTLQEQKQKIQSIKKIFYDKETMQTK